MTVEISSNDPFADRPAKLCYSIGDKSRKNSFSQVLYIASFILDNSKYGLKQDLWRSP